MKTFYKYLSLLLTLAFITPAFAVVIPGDSTSASIFAKGIIPSATLSTPSSNVTLASTSNSVQIYTPSASIDVTLPSTNVTAGQLFKIVNRSTVNTITIKAANGSERTNILSGYVELYALVANPNGVGDWFVTDAKSDFVYSVTVTNYATTKTVVYHLRRNGGNLEGTVVVSAASSFSGSPMSLTLSGMTIDPSRTTISTTIGQVVGSFNAIGSTSKLWYENTYGGLAIAYDSTNIRFSSISNGNAWTYLNGSSTGEPNIHFQISVPIANWAIGN